MVDDGEFRKRPEDSDAGIGRRGVLELATVLGLGALAGSGRAATTPTDVTNSAETTVTGPLDMDGNGIANVGDVSSSADASTWYTSGSGDGSITIRDRSQDEYLWRASEGGTVEINGDVSVDGTMSARSLSGSSPNVVNVVSDLGVEPGSGTDLGGAIDDYLYDKVQNGETIEHLFVIPAGTYEWNTQLGTAGSDKADLDEFEYLGFVGRPHATLNVSNPDCNHLFVLGSKNGEARRGCLKNVTVNIEDEGETVIDAGLIKARIDEYFELSDVDVVGKRVRFQDREPSEEYEYEWESPARFSEQIQVTDTDGIAIIRGLRMLDGGTYRSERDDGGNTAGHAIPCSSDPKHIGRKFYVGCDVRNFVDNGYYVDNSPGINRLINCVAKNNGGSNFRLGGNDFVHGGVSEQTSTAAFAGTCVDLNGAEDESLWDTTWSDRSIEAEKAAEHTTVEGLTILNETGGDVVRVRSETLSAEFRDMTVKNTASSRIFDLSGDPTAETRSIAITNVRIVDEGSDSSQNACFYVMRPNVVVENVAVESDDRWIFRLDDATDDTGALARSAGRGFTVRDCHLSPGDTEGTRGVFLIETTHTGDARVDAAMFNTRVATGRLHFTDDNAAIDGITVADCDLRDATSTSPVGDSAVGEWIFRDNRGYVTENGGSMVADDGQTIPHGLDVEPDTYGVNSTSSGYNARIVSVTDSSMTVEITDESDAGGASGVTISWFAERHTY